MTPAAENVAPKRNTITASARAGPPTSATGAAKPRMRHHENARPAASTPSPPTGSSTCRLRRRQSCRPVGYAIDIAYCGRWRSRQIPFRSLASPTGPGASGLGLFLALLAQPDRADEQMGDVDDLEGPLRLARRLLGVDGVAEHDHAVRAGGGDGVGVEGEGLFDPVVVDAAAGALLEPHAGAAGAAAESVALAAVHFLGLGAGDGVDDLPGRRVDLVVAAEEARVVVGDLLVDRVDRGELAVLDQLGQQLGVVDDLVVAPQLGVLAADGVEAVRAGRDDLLPGPGADPGLVEGLDVLLGEHLEDELVAQPAGGVAGAGLGRAQDRELDPGDVQQLGDRLGRLLRPVLKRARAAD